MDSRIRCEGGSACLIEHAHKMTIDTMALVLFDEVCPRFHWQCVIPRTLSEGKRKNKFEKQC